MTRKPFLLLSIVRSEENTGYESVLGCWVVSWRYWLNIEYVSLVCLSDITAAGTISHKLYGFRKILGLWRSSTEQVCWSLLGMHWGFSQYRSGSVIPFLIDVSDFCRSFKKKRNYTIKTYITHHVLLVNEVYNVIKRNSLFHIRTTIWYKIILRTQNRMSCKLCRIIRRDLDFIVIAHRFLQREKLFKSDKVEHWILIVSRYWWETSPVVGYVGSRKKRVAVVKNDF